MSDSWVRDRMQAGDFPRPGLTANEYVEAHVDFKVRKLATSGEGTATFEVERTRLTKEQADKIATANALDRKELASLPDMTMAVTSVIAVSMGRLMRVPAIVAKLRQEQAALDAVSLRGSRRKTRSRSRAPARTSAATLSTSSFRRASPRRRSRMLSLPKASG